MLLRCQVHSLPTLLATSIRRATRGLLSTGLCESNGVRGIKFTVFTRFLLTSLITFYTLYYSQELVFYFKKQKSSPITDRSIETKKSYFAKHQAELKSRYKAIGIELEPAKVEYKEPEDGWR